MNTPVIAFVDDTNRPMVELHDLDTEIVHASAPLDDVMDDLYVEYLVGNGGPDCDTECEHWDRLKGDHRREEIEQQVRDWAKRNRFDITELNYSTC